jgi:hypothetical protein
MVVDYLLHKAFIRFLVGKQRLLTIAVPAVGRWSEIDQLW